MNPLELNRRSFIGWTAALAGTLLLPSLGWARRMGEEAGYIPDPSNPNDLQALIDWTWRRGGGLVPLLPGVIYTPRNPLRLRQGVRLAGCGVDIDHFRRATFPHGDVDSSLDIDAYCSYQATISYGL